MKKKNLKDIIYIAVIIVLTVEVIWMSLVNRKLNIENSKLHFLLYTPSDVIPSEHKSAMLPGIQLRSMETGQVTGLLDIAAQVENMLIICVFSTDCQSCDLAAETWNEIYGGFGDRYTVIGISKSDIPSMEDYVRRNNVEFPVFQYESMLRVELFTSLPQTLVVAKSGRIAISIKGFPDKLQNKLMEDLIK